MSGKSRSRRLLVSFEEPAAPSADDVRRAREAIAGTAGVRVLDELPGTIQVEVAAEAAPELLERVTRLPGWSVVEERAVELPDAHAPRASRKRTR